MRKVLALGSICAVLVLVFASLSPVVGFNKVKSNIKESPLFLTRISKVINEEKDVSSSNYVGKNSNLDLPIPKRNYEQYLINKIINRLDKETLDRLLNIIKNKNNQLELDIEKIEDIESLQITAEIITICQWFPGCIPVAILYILAGALLVLLYLLTIFPYHGSGCIIN